MRRWTRWLAAAGLLVLALAAVRGLVGERDLVLAVSAPAEADGVTIFAARQQGFGDVPSLQANYRIEYQGRVVHPPGGVGGVFILNGGKGHHFLPYGHFVEGNGQYNVVVSLDGATARSTVGVTKWVEFVYLHPYWKNNRAVVDLQLSKASGGSPDDRVIARGDLILEVRHRGIDGSLNSYSGVLREELPGEESFARIPVPPSTFSKGPGWYSFEATFHNEQAKGNTGVRNDPAMAGRSPAWNWIYVKP